MTRPRLFYVNYHDRLVELQNLKVRVGGLLPTRHLPLIDTLLMPVKSIGLFKTLVFLPCVPESMAFLAI